MAKGDYSAYLRFRNTVASQLATQFDIIADNHICAAIIMCNDKNNNDDSMKKVHSQQTLI